MQSKNNNNPGAIVPYKKKKRDYNSDEFKQVIMELRQRGQLVDNIVIERQKMLMELGKIQNTNTYTAYTVNEINNRFNSVNAKLDKITNMLEQRQETPDDILAELFPEYAVSEKCRNSIIDTIKVFRQYGKDFNVELLKEYLIHPDKFNDVLNALKTLNKCIKIID